MTDGPSINLPLDHVGILCADLGTTISSFRSLGFDVQGPERLQMGAGQHFTQQSAHIVFENTYIELTSINGDAREHPVAPWLASGDGLRLLILNTQDIVAAHADADAKGLSPSAVQQASRIVPYGDRGEARFSWVSLRAGAFPEAVVGFVQHQTPERVFAPEAKRHVNGAIEIERLWQVSDDPMQSAERFSRLSADGCSMSFLNNDLVSKIFPGLAQSMLPALNAFQVGVKSLSKVQAILEDAEIECRAWENGLVTNVSGAALVFSETQR